MFYPDDRKYSPHHVWVKAAEEEALVGVSEDLHDELVEIESVDLPMPGEELEIDGVCISFHLPNSIWHINSPLSGHVVETNMAMADRPGDIFLSPYDEGWLFKVEYDDSAELELLMNAEEYTYYLE